ncbi:MAG: hypothetical protein ABIP89_08905 [Polyangiaceae bacterium]
MTAARYQRIIRAACGCTLAALAMMVWSIFDPRPLPVVGAMSVGQVLGTLSLGAFLYVVLADMHTKHFERAPVDSEVPPVP